MRVGDNLTRGAALRCVLVVAVAVWGSASPRLVMAQDAPAPMTSALLTLDQERLFAESVFGKASLERERAATQALEEENSRIDADLNVEEQDLTVRRKTMPAAEFAPLAAAFDAKVERIRTEQDTKARDLTRARDEDRAAFLRAVVPVLGELMASKGAVAVLDKATVVLSLTAIDITDEAIAEVDAVFAAGETLPEVPVAPAAPP